MRTSTGTSCVPPTGRTVALLERAQELGLQRERHLADLVEEERAAVGLLEEARRALLGVGERAAHVAEQLALEQRLGHRRAVDARRTGRSRRRLRAWSARATTSLPVPLSPVMSTGRSESATRAMRS